MQWEQLTAPEFSNAVRDTGVCILPLGVLERHSDHLPLGTDFLNAHRIASLAAEREAASMAVDQLTEPLACGFHGHGR